MANFSVWQGNVCLGYSALEEEGKRPGKRSGRFEPTLAAETLGPLMQVHEARMPGVPVMQHPLPRAEEWQSLPSRAEAVEIIMAPTGSETITSVAADKLLELRDKNGEVVPTQTIAIMQRPLVQGEIAGGGLWRLSVTLVEPLPSAT